MKFRLLTLCALLGGLAAAAQNPYMAVLGAIESADGIVVSNPRTILAVDVEVECDRILCGPYARYAQKFFGTRAPLNDKTVWTVTGARIALLDDDTYLNAEPLAPSVAETASYAVSDGEFPKLQIDKFDLLVPSLEDAARTAANRIFSLRRHRMELITGEAGENVFGAGLDVALKEIERQEQGYLELFFGKRVVSTETRRYVVYPQSDRKQYIVCRFSASAGLLPENDLSGDIVLLQTEPSEAPVAEALEASHKESSTVKCRVADPTTCTVLSNGREYARAVLPIFEFGRTIDVALPRRK